MLGKTNVTNNKKIDLTGDATEESVLEGKTFYSNNADAKKTGTMSNHGFLDLVLESPVGAFLSDHQTLEEGYYSGGSITVNPVSTQSKTVTPSTSKQTINPDAGKLLSSVVVNAVSTQTKSVTPSSSQQIVKPDSGKFLSQVTVNAIPTMTNKQSINFNNVTNQNITISKAVTNGYLFCMAMKDNIGSLYCYAKKVSGSGNVTLLYADTGIYPNSARGGICIYKLDNCAVGMVLNLWATNAADSTNANAAAGFVGAIFGF